MEEETKLKDFDVSIPTADGSAIAKWITVQIPVRYTPGVTPEGEEVLTPEAHDIIDQTKSLNWKQVIDEAAAY